MLNKFKDYKWHVIGIDPLTGEPCYYNVESKQIGTVMRGLHEDEARRIVNAHNELVSELLAELYADE